MEVGHLEKSGWTIHLHFSELVSHGTVWIIAVAASISQSEGSSLILAEVVVHPVPFPTTRLRKRPPLLNCVILFTFF